MLCFRASPLKNSTLRLLNAIVTLTPSSRKTRSSGRGRKSRTTLNLPSDSSVYLILALINCLTPSPVTSAKDSNDILAIREANRQYSAIDSTEAVVPLLPGTMREIFCDHAGRIRERKLRTREGDAMLPLVLLILVPVPLETNGCHLRDTSTEAPSEPYGRMASQGHLGAGVTPNDDSGSGWADLRIPADAARPVGLFRRRGAVSAGISCEIAQRILAHAPADAGRPLTTRTCGRPGSGRRQVLALVCRHCPGWRSGTSAPVSLTDAVPRS